MFHDACIQYTTPIEDFLIEKWDAIIAVNLTPSFHTIQIKDVAKAQNIVINEAKTDLITFISQRIKIRNNYKSFRNV